MNIEKVLSIVVNRLCLLVGMFAVLPIAVGWLVFNFFLFRFFEAESIVVDDIVWQVLGIGFACLLFVLMILFTSLMESFDKELKKLYWEIKNRKKC